MSEGCVSSKIAIFLRFRVIKTKSGCQSGRLWHHLPSYGSLILPCRARSQLMPPRWLCGGVLEQEEHGLWRPVAYYSSKLLPAEQRYTTRERECLAVKQCLVVWRHYLLGAPFQVKVKSDHESLKWLKTQDVSTLSDRLLCWSSSSASLTLIRGIFQVPKMCSLITFLGLIVLWL